MTRLLVVMGIFVLFTTAVVVAAQEEFEMDIIETPGGNLKITFIGHGTLMFTFGGKVIHVDPFSRLADYAKLPKADMILITHEHRDHLDLKALKALRTEKTTVILTKTCSRQVEGGIVMNNGDVKSVEGLKIEAVPAYNIIGQPFHPKGVGNGYVITFGEKRVYVAGDTENVPEMKELKWGKGFQTKNPLSLSLWQDRYIEDRRSTEGDQRDRGTHPKDALGRYMGLGSALSNPVKSAP
jgi:hypothetical protein